MRNLFFILIAFLLLLTGCNPKTTEATVEIDKDGYVVINGEKTEHRVHTTDVIYLSIDGYVIVNNKKTDYRVHTGDEIFVNADGLLVVNGQITQYEVNSHTPDYTTQTIPATCTQEGYDLRTCNICGHSQKENIQPTTNHSWGTEYQINGVGHWLTCTQCGDESPIQEHAEDSTGHCSQCKISVGATEGVVYDLSEDESYAIVIGYTGTANNIRISSEYLGKPVTEIYDNAFKNTSIVSVVIPNSVTKIGTNAFEDCRYLADVTIGSNVKTIGNRAFYFCQSLTSIVIPDSVETIGHSAFYYTSLESVTLGSSLMFIGSYAFFQADFSNIQLPYSLRIIDDCAFSECRELQSIVIPEGVTHMGSQVFKDCVALTEAYILGTLPKIDFGTFYNCSSLKNVAIGEGVLAIDSIFEYCYNLQTISLPNSLLNISDHDTFKDLPIEAYAEYMDGLYLGNKINPYAVFVMPASKNLTEYTIHPDTKFIMPSAFAECTRAKTISIPDGIVNVGNSLVSDCKNLQYNVYQGGKYLGDETNPYVVLVEATEPIIHPDTKVIGNGVFKNKTLDSFQIPEGVRSIGSYAFYDARCSKLTLPDSLVMVGSGAFSYLNMTYFRPHEDLVMPQGLVYIEADAFDQCNMLGEILRLPDTVRYIEGYSFNNTHSSTVVLPSGLAALTSASFRNTHITQLLFPSSILFFSGDPFIHSIYSINTIYYTGTLQEWERMITISGYSESFFNATTYFYSETQPTQPGNFWRDVNGIPTPW